MCDQSTTQEAAAFCQKVLLLCSHTLLGNWHKVFSIRSLYWVDLPLGKKDEHYKNFLLGSRDQKVTIKVLKFGILPPNLLGSQKRGQQAQQIAPFWVWILASQKLVNIQDQWQTSHFNSRGKAIAGEKEDPNDNTGEGDMPETNCDVFQPPHAQSCNSLPAIL